MQAIPHQKLLVIDSVCITPFFFDPDLASAVNANLKYTQIQEDETDISCSCKIMRTIQEDED